MRITAVLLTVTMFLTMLPLNTVHAEESFGIRDSVASQIDKFISSTGKGVTPSNAVSQMLSQALYGKGKTLNANIDSPITVAIIKSEMTRHMLVYTIAIAGGIVILAIVCIVIRRKIK